MVSRGTTAILVLAALCALPVPIDATELGRTATGLSGDTAVNTPAHTASNTPSKSPSDTPINMPTHTPPPWSDAVGAALAVVLRAHPTLRARNAEFVLMSGEPRWSSELRLAVSEGVVDDEAGGRAMLTLRIPLVGGPERRQRAQAWRELEVARDGVREAFLADVGALLAQAQLRVNHAEHRDFWHERVAYHAEAVEAQLLAPERLWAVAEQLQAAEFAVRNATLALDAELERMARRHGGDEWTHLRRWLVEIVTCSTDAGRSTAGSTC